MLITPFFNVQNLQNMFRGFKLSLSNELTEYYKIGLRNCSNHQSAIKKQLEGFSSNGILKGEMLETKWFQSVEADVFISHSHMDERLAISFAGWLSSNFGIKSFVDSTVWQNANDLLKLVDDDLCCKPLSGTYDYQRRNRTTAHIHMMLNAAIMKMMDRTECFFLINTPNAISTSGVVEETFSPWLYAELSMSKLLRVKKPIRPLFESTKLFSGGEVDLIKAERIMTHRAETGHLISLNAKSLTTWHRLTAGTKEAMTALDCLYYYDDLIKVS